MPNTKRQTSNDNLADLIVNLGGTPKTGGTNADLLDQLETMIGSGGASPAEVRSIVEELLPDALRDAIETGGLTDDEVEDLFGP